MQSTFLLVEHPAKASPSPDSERDWMIRVATLCSLSWPSLAGMLPSGSFGRMSLACCPSMKGGLLAPSSEGWQNSGMGSPTEFWTLNSSEWPKDAAVCSLSAVLEDNGSVPQRLYLSAKACAGILRRAEKRGKELPRQLRVALMAVAQTGQADTADDANSLCIAPTISARQRGGGGLGTDAECDGACIPILEVGKREGVKGDKRDGLGIGKAGDLMFTLQSSAQHGVCHSLRADGFDASEDGTGRGTPLIPTVIAHGQAGSEMVSDGEPSLTCNHEAPIAFQPRIARNGRGDMGDRVNALQAQSGQTGKGDAAPCIAFQPRYFTRDNKTGGAESCRDQTSALSAEHGGGDSATCVAFQSSQTGVREVDSHATLDSNNGSRRHNGVVQGYAVRRLGPTECERLQGFPDGWTAIEYHGKPACDGPRYKALGNSMAVPVVKWIGQRIAEVSKVP